jgi:hypothetical protein
VVWNPVVRPFTFFRLEPGVIEVCFLRSLDDPCGLVKRLGVASGMAPLYRIERGSSRMDRSNSHVPCGVQLI